MAPCSPPAPAPALDGHDNGPKVPLPGHLLDGAPDEVAGLGDGDLGMGGRAAMGESGGRGGADENEARVECRTYLLALHALHVCRYLHTHAL